MVCMGYVCGVCEVGRYVVCGVCEVGRYVVCGVCEVSIACV